MTRAFLLSLALFVLGSAAILAPELYGADDAIYAIDGDTVRQGDTVYRLVGFDAPETGRLARCGAERAKGEAAKARLRQIIAGGGIVLLPIPCSCKPGTEGTSECNYGRQCARLSARGVDVGDILIAEGLARAYACGARSCPPRQGWC